MTLKDYAKFHPWLMQIARNHCKDYLSKKGRQSPAVSLDSIVDLLVDYNIRNTFTVSLDAVALRIDTVEALKKLPEEFRLPLYMHYCRGMTAPEIAVAINSSVATAKWRIHRALEICRLLMLEQRSENHV